jgi:ADP-ribose pyrophosphatase YjhB (NUDIX family)
MFAIHSGFGMCLIGRNNMVECRTLYGGTRMVPVKKLQFRPSAYAVILHEGKILLERMKSTGAYCLPGGGIELGERMEDGLKREVREETGVEIEIRRLAHFNEDFFYYDPLDKAFHSFMFFFVCRPLTMELIPGGQVDDFESETPRWVDAAGLGPKVFYNDGEAILKIVASET